ncbi:MAG: AAA family ATPase [Deltaproteobacteria bacterium]|nr:AAA family ATPase [Desulfitobacteriaceae bacterium]MDI6855089.1 AAA family ATPase [Deltaproteobacteria bacterium]
MNSERLRVSILYGAGQEDPRLREVLEGLPNLKFAKQAVDPQVFLTQHAEYTPDLVLVDLDGMTRVPDWLKEVKSHFPRSQFVVCSESRDPDFLIGLMKLKVGAFVPLPLDSGELQETIERLRHSLQQERTEEQAASQIVAVTGTKGGVGITSLAVNLAVALAEVSPGEVVLADLARPFPHVGQFLDLRGSHTVADLIHSADSLDPVFIQKVVQRHKSSLDVLLSDVDNSLDANCISDSQSLKKILAALRNSYNWIVIDIGSWIDVLYASLVKDADHVLLITELSVPDLQNLKRLRAFYYDWDVDDQKISLVVNRYEKDYALGLRDLENIFLKPVSFTLPSDYAALIDAINQGLPLSEVAPRSKLWRGLKGMARDLIDQQKRARQSSAKKGLIKRLFG